ncbi:MAG: MlaD family protein [Candidatus Cryptobacteroides sp.]
MKRETKIGVFAVAVLTSTFFVVNYLRGADVFSRDVRIVSHYKNVEGLTPSNPVYMRGYKAGSVTSVEYNPTTDMFDVTCSVKKKLNIPADTKMTIYSVDLMGGKGIRLDLGTSPERISDGAELEPSYAPDMVSSLTNMIGPLIEKFTVVLDSLKVTEAELNRILEGVDENTVRSIIDNADRALSNVEKLSSGLAGRSPEIDELLVNLKTVSGRLVSICASADTAMTGLSSVAGQLSAADLEGLLSSMRSVLQNLSSSETSLGRLFTEDEMYDTLKSLVNDIDSLVKNIEENPKKYLRIKASIF